MGTTIGEVNINLRMSLAQFQSDVKAGAAAAGSATKQIAQDTGSNIGEARETLRLLSEDVGVTIPRGLQSLIAGIPAVGTALQAAFSVIAIVAVADLIDKIITKLQSFKNAADATDAAWNAVGAESTAAMLSLNNEALKLQIELDKLTGNDLKALQDQFKLIDGQTLQNITAQLQALQKTADAAYDSMQRSWWQSLTDGIPQDLKDKLGEFADGAKVLANNLVDAGKQGLMAMAGLNPMMLGLESDTSSTNEKVAILKQSFDDLSARVLRYKAAGDSVGASNAITEAISKIQAAITKANQAGADPRYAEALQGTLGLLDAMKERYAAVQQVGDTTKLVASIKAANDAWNEQIDTLQKLADASDRLLDKGQDTNTKQQSQIRSLILDWANYAEELAASGRYSKIADDATAALSARLRDLQGQAQGAMDKLTGMTEADRKLVEQLVGSAANKPVMPVLGDTAEMQKYNAALTALLDPSNRAKMSTTELAAAVQQLNFQFGVGGAATGVKQFFEQFQAGDQMAKQTFDLLKTGVDGFEQNLAETLATGKANWADYFNSLDEMLLKMSLNTLFQDALGMLNASSFLGTNAGGLFGQGGLFGPPHADGGPVDAGVLYPVGEQGPEWFKPSVPGTIIPNGGFKSSGGSKGSSGQTIVQNISINGVQDADSFKKSMPQVRAEMYRSAAQAHGRLNR